MRDSTKQFDAVIIGGGVIGCVIAWRLGQAGMQVVVVERGEVGREASRAAGGMLAPLAEADRANDFFQLAVASRAMYADFSRELRRAGGIDIEYRTEGTLYLALTAEDEEDLDRRWQWQHAAGLNVKRLSAGCVRKLEPLVNEDLRWALKFPDDHQVNNRQLMIALANAARSVGVEFLTHTEGRRLLLESRAGRQRVRGIDTTRGVIRSSHVIISAGSWSSLLTVNDGQTLDYFKVEPVRGQMIALEAPAAAVSHVIYSNGGYLVPRSPRGRSKGLLLAGSTTEQVGYDNRATAGGIGSIIKHVTEIMPCAGELAIREIWAGLRPRASDELPILGVDPFVEGLIYATAHYRNGILLTPITGQVISELLINGESRIPLAPFSVARFIHRQAAL
jgi:glycine oxidase